MKSGLEGRNNLTAKRNTSRGSSSLNEVRPGRPEQCAQNERIAVPFGVSMKSGLEDRNNPTNRSVRRPG